jgi:hypothetical protein
MSDPLRHFSMRGAKPTHKQIRRLQRDALALRLLLAAGHTTKIKLQQSRRIATRCLSVSMRKPSSVLERTEEQPASQDKQKEGIL